MSVENLDMEDKLLKDFRFFNNIVDNYKSKTWKRKSYD